MTPSMPRPRGKKALYPPRQRGSFSGGQNKTGDDPVRIEGTRAQKGLFQILRFFLPLFRFKKAAL